MTIAAERPFRPVRQNGFGAALHLPRLAAWVALAAVLVLTARGGALGGACEPVGR